MQPHTHHADLHLLAQSLPTMSLFIQKTNHNKLTNRPPLAAAAPAPAPLPVPAPAPRAPNSSVSSSSSSSSNKILLRLTWSIHAYERKLCKQQPLYASTTLPYSSRPSHHSTPSTPSHSTHRYCTQSRRSQPRGLLFRKQPSDTDTDFACVVACKVTKTTRKSNHITRKVNPVAVRLSFVSACRAIDFAPCP
jgi:hypothetical protein